MQRVGANINLKSPNRGAVAEEDEEEAVEVSSPRNKNRSLAENEEEVPDGLDIAVGTSTGADCNGQRDSRRSEERSDLFHTILRQKSKTNSAGSGGGAAAGGAAVGGTPEVKYIR